MEKEEADIGRGGRGRRPSETHLQESRIEEESHRVRLPSHTHAQVNDTRHEDGEIATIAWIVIMAKVSGWMAVVVVVVVIGVTYPVLYSVTYGKRRMSKLIRIRVVLADYLAVNDYD